MASVDTVLRSAVDLARAAAEEVAEIPGIVGEHQGVVVEGERLIAHRFASTAPGYRGWSWTVTLARVPRARTATVCEVELLPGPDAVLAPAWVPWSDRLRPGDLGPGDALPYLPDDDRLEPGYTATGDEDADRVAVDELGLGRERVLSREGRTQAAERWYTGSHGPTAPVAVTAEKPCSTCGFLMLMAGSLRTVFGVCANEWSPDDGRVVSMDHGCGAHSETDVPHLASDWPAPPSSADELEIVRREAEPGADAEAEAEPTVEAVVGAEADVEPQAEAPADTTASGREDGPEPAAALPEPVVEEDSVVEQDSAVEQVEQDSVVEQVGQDSAVEQDSGVGPDRAVEPDTAVLPESVVDGPVIDLPTDLPADAEGPARTRRRGGGRRRAPKAE